MFGGTLYQPIKPEMSKMNSEYEITELFIEPIVVNVLRVLAANGTVTQLATNIPLEEICHTDDVLELTQMNHLPFDEALSKSVFLNEVCKVCLKDLTDSPDKILFHDDFGQVSAEVVNISAALESMNVEITNDVSGPKQMCIECFNIFSKMTLFQQICKRSKRALANINEFVAQQQSNVKVEVKDTVPLLCYSPVDIVDIKEEQDELPDPELVNQQLIEMDDSAPAVSSNDPGVPKSCICNRCGGNFDHRNSVVYHKRYELCVKAINPQCRFCEATLPTVMDLDHHLENAHTGYPCTKCDKSFTTVAKFNKHQRCHRVLICDFCGQIFFSKRHIRKHLQHHVFNTFACLFCTQTFKTPKSLGVHKRRVHPDELYKCPHCPKEFKLKDRYRVHLMKHNPDKPHKCTFCPSQFVHRHHLENHVRTHTKETPFLCNFCGKAFRGEVALRAHLSTHDSVAYPYRYRYRKPPKILNCKLCDFVSTYGNMKKHMMHEHGHGSGRTSKDFEYSCLVCEKKFRLAASLDNHVKIHDEERNFHCTYCKQSFRKANYLRLHIDGVHLNKKPNKCDQCNAAYLISNDLRRHKLQRHSTERPFECYYCSKRFAMASSLKVHIKLQHRVTISDS
ncbi:hypothetical protein HA402_014803 [Bradysia odoriphaga]|nr:hypothetical protein HA402_014803 [Bradysia odoriphaga]